MNQQETISLLPSRQEMERALARRSEDYDGLFFTAVRTTGIFCRPSCPSKPNPANVEFFATVAECMEAGYRACKRCLPMGASGKPPLWVSELMQRVEAEPERRFDERDLTALGITPERARRWFKKHLGMSFADWRRGVRLSGALDRLRHGANLDDVAFDSGFESHSGFRDAFARTFGQPPGRARSSDGALIVTVFESPIGPLLAGATEGGIALLEFTDPVTIAAHMENIRHRARTAVVPGHLPLLEKLERELKLYFSGRLKEFTLPLKPIGTEFQKKVWLELCNIPYGGTMSYEELAVRIGNPSACRAVARANGANPICIVVPCHRVIGKNGTLTGYGGGLWRKRHLLELEQNRKLPLTNSSSNHQAARK